MTRVRPGRHSPGCPWGRQFRFQDWFFSCLSGQIMDRGGDIPEFSSIPPRAALCLFTPLTTAAVTLEPDSQFDVSIQVERILESPDFQITRALLIFRYLCNTPRNGPRKTRNIRILSIIVILEENESLSKNNLKDKESMNHNQQALFSMPKVKGKGSNAKQSECRG